MKGPIWQFSGIGLFAMLMIWGSYANRQDEIHEKEYIASPMEGDIYLFKVDEGSYSSLKVIRVTSDSVSVSSNNYETNKQSGIYRIDKAENYIGESFAISKERLNELYQTKYILAINRD